MTNNIKKIQDKIAAMADAFLEITYEGDEVTKADAIWG